MADLFPGIRLTSSTQAALQRIATAPATSEQGLSGAADAVWEAFNDVAERVGVFEDYGDALAAAIRTAAEQCIAIPGHNPSTEWLAGFQAARRATHEQLQAIAAELEGHGPH